MSRGRETWVVRRATRSATIWIALLVLLAPLAACGGPAAADVAPYLGSWLRVDVGEPNPDFTLTIADREGATVVTFADHANGLSQTVPATMEGGSLACVLPTGDDPAPGSGATSPAPFGAPTESQLRLSVDENGRLVVDLVLGDGTLEPIWIYERAAGAAPIGP